VRGPRAYEQGARQQLRRFRQGTALAVALTALLLLVWAGPLELEGQQPDEPAADTLPALPTDPAVAVDEATATIFDLVYGFYAFLPRLVIVILLFTVAALAARTVHAVLRRTLREWQRREAVSALARLAVFLVAIIASLSVLAGDVRAIVGSVGLLGLAASWALQTPIESFTGWLLNSFRTYYRVGDRISVGEVFGDVYRIDVLTTTVWEAGGPGKPVAAAQATGALITFPNWEVLRSNVTNYSRFFPTSGTRSRSTWPTRAIWRIRRMSSKGPRAGCSATRWRWRRSATRTSSPGSASPSTSMRCRTSTFRWRTPGPTAPCGISCRSARAAAGRRPSCSRSARRSSGPSIRGASCPSTRAPSSCCGVSGPSPARHVIFPALTVRAWRVSIPRAALTRTRREG
jgi:small-conductance mechanosensitive channel